MSEAMSGPTSARKVKSVVSKSRVGQDNLADGWCQGRRIVRVNTLTRFKQRLRQRGWKCVGEGCYGAAWAKGNLVWKIGTRDSGSHSGDYDGYKLYAWSILQGFLGDSRFLPRMRLMLADNDGGYAVLMERLAETYYGARDRPHQWAVNVKLDDLTLSLKHDRQPDSLDWWERERGEGFKPIEPLRRIGERLHEWFIATGLVGQFDLHDQNWMLRSNGEIVLTDPLT